MAQSEAVSSCFSLLLFPLQGAIIKEKTDNILAQTSGIGVENMNVRVPLSVFVVLITPLMLATVNIHSKSRDPQSPIESTTSFIGSVYIPEHLLFSFTTSMNVARWVFSAILLNDGKVLVAGGNGVGAPDTTELYDPSTGTWSATGNLNFKRDNYSAVLLNNGKVLLTGGTDGKYALNSSELYDPSTGEWSITGNTNSKRVGQNAIVLNNGKVLITGGWDGGACLASAELYDPSTGTWSLTGSMNSPRCSHCFSLLQDGSMLVAGGNEKNDGSTKLKSAEIYNPSTKTWSTSAI